MIKMRKYKQLELLLTEIELALFQLKKYAQSWKGKRAIYYQIKENNIKNRILYLKERIK